VFTHAKRPITLEQESSGRQPKADDPKKARQQAYRRVGVYVVDNCDVLIALWDGKAPKKQGEQQTL